MNEFEFGHEITRKRMKNEKQIETKRKETKTVPQNMHLLVRYHQCGS